MLPTIVKQHEYTGSRAVEGKGHETDCCVRRSRRRRVTMISFRWLLSTFIQYIFSFYEYCQQLIKKYFTGKVITFDTGKRVIVGKQIAEGGFSYIFLAYDAASATTARAQQTRRTNVKQPPQQNYALKRIHCPDTELIDRCRYEADVHRDVMKQNSHVMPLYGFTIIQHDCFMLFPLCTESLRDMINRKNPYLKQQQQLTIASTTMAPISQIMVLQLFRQICHGVQALHKCGYTHRDIKIENVMILPNDQRRTSNALSTAVPPHLLIMDFGSAGPVELTIHNRKQVLEIVEQASQHTTLPYRPPELFDGGIRYNQSTGTTVLDYRAVDVWSLGCTLHAIMYGASPFECEFPVAPSTHYSNTVSGGGGGGASAATMGTIKIVDCTHLSILGNVPVPKYVPIASWYDESIRNELLLPMLRPEPKERPKLDALIEMIERMIVQLGGANVDMPSIANGDNNNYHDGDHHRYRDHVEDVDSDGIALLSRMA